MAISIIEIDGNSHPLGASANNVAFDGTGTGIEAGTVQEAIEEVSILAAEGAQSGVVDNLETVDGQNALSAGMGNKLDGKASVVFKHMHWVAGASSPSLDFGVHERYYCPENHTIYHFYGRIYASQLTTTTLSYQPSKEVIYYDLETATAWRWDGTNMVLAVHPPYFMIAYSTSSATIDGYNPVTPSGFPYPRLVWFSELGKLVYLYMDGQTPRYVAFDPDPNRVYVYLVGSPKVVQWDGSAWVNVIDISSKANAADVANTYATKSELTSGLSGKQNTLTFDDAPDPDSQNPVTSGGIAVAIANKLSQVTVNAIPSGSVAIIDDCTTGGSTNVLSAEQGKELSERITEIAGGIAYEDTEQEVTEDVTFIKGAYINTGQAYNNNTAVDLNSAASYAATDYAVVNLNAGERLDIRGIGGGTNGGRLWAVLDKTTHMVQSIAEPTESATLPIASPITASITAESDCIVVIVVYNETIKFNNVVVPYANTAHTPYYAKVTKTVIVPVGTPIDGILGDMQEDIEDNAAAIQENTEAIEDLTPYKGLKYVALGDSITYGYIPRNAPGHIVGGNAQLPDGSYAALAAQRLGMTFVNAGITGSSVTNISGRNPMCVRYADLPNDADVITVMGGTNDITNGAVLGTMADRGTNTFYGALHVLMQGLYTKYIAGAALSVGKKKKIIICTPIKRMDRSKENLANTVENNATVLTQWDTWIDAIKEVAAFYSFPVLDMYNLSELNPHLDRTLRGTTDGYTGLYNPYIPDGVHPTQEGQEMMADLLVGFIKSLK